MIGSVLTNYFNEPKVSFLKFTRLKTRDKNEFFKV